MVVGGLVTGALALTTGAARACLWAGLAAIVVVFLYALYLQPRFATDVIEWYEPRVRWRVRTAQPVAALTIDDVPNYDHSRIEEILDILRENGARATLFVMSACLAHAPEALQTCVADAVKEGLVELGNHSAFDEPAVGLSDGDFRAKHDHCDKALEAIQGSHAWLRPGSGLANGRILDWCDARGYRVVLGNCDPRGGEGASQLSFNMSLDCREESVHALRSPRTMIARPKNRQIESKPTEIGASKVGRVSRCCCRPGYPHDPLDATRFVNPAYLRRRVRPGAASWCLHFCLTSFRTSLVS